MVTDKGGIYTVFNVPSQTVRACNYYLTWDGGGTLAITNNGTLAGSLVSPAASTGNFFYFQLTNTSTLTVTFRIAAITSSSDYPHNIRVYSDLDGGAPPDYPTETFGYVSAKTEAGTVWRNQVFK